MYSGNALLEDAEIRSSAIKSMIRFWWRAMQQNCSLEELQNNEAKIFGGAGADQIKSKLQVAINETNIRLGQGALGTKTIREAKIKGDGSNITRDIDLTSYMTYGMDNKEKKRKYIVVGSIFQIKLIFDPGLQIGDQEDLIKALYCVSLIGGIGAKSRNGLGRFVITERNDEKQHFDLLTLLLQIDKSPRKSYTAFSDETILLKTDPQLNSIDWHTELARIWEAYKRAKSGVDEREHDVRNRQYVALPVNGSSFGKKPERHSKTYFLTITEESGFLQGYIVFLPYLFLKGMRNNGYSDNQVSEFQMKYTEANTKFIGFLTGGLKMVVL
jgi:CRISPR type III-B/RAMP module RAMP protein Cmr1